MNDTIAALKRKPVLSVIATAILALSLLTPLIFIFLPVITAVALSIASVFRKEKPTWLAYLVIAVSIVLLIASERQRSSRSAEPPVMKASEIYDKATWDYSSTKDKMRDTITPDATLYSATDIDLPPPYDGNNAASIFVDPSDGIMLTVEKSQFECGTDANVAVKIDGGRIWDYPCSMNNNGQTNYVFINSQFSPEPGQPVDPKNLLSKGNSMTIETSFFDAGTRQIVFHIAGFNPSKIK